MTKRTLLAAALLAPAAALTFTLGGAGGLDDTTQVKQLAKDFQSAGNKHDSKAIADLFARDADLVCPDGKVETGAREVEGFFTENFAPTGMMKSTNIDVKKETTRFITPDVALSDWECTMTGGARPDGAEMGPMTNHVVMISKKEGGTWKFAAARPGIPQTEEQIRDMKKMDKPGKSDRPKSGE